MRNQPSRNVSAVSSGRAKYPGVTDVPRSSSSPTCRSPRRAPVTGIAHPQLEAAQRATEERQPAGVTAPVGGRGDPLVLEHRRSTVSTAMPVPGCGKEMASVASAMPYTQKADFESRPCRAPASRNASTDVGVDGLGAVERHPPR